MIASYYPDEVEDWHVEFLLRAGTRKHLKEVLAFGACRQKMDRIKPTFNIVGSLSHQLLELVEDETMVFSELFRILSHIPRIPGDPKCDAAYLKNLLSFLVNFGKVQLFNLAFSGLTVVTADKQKREAPLDYIFRVADMIEVMRRNG